MAASFNPKGGALGAVIFDLDGVVTDTACAHASAWKAVFDDYFDLVASRGGNGVRPFDRASDYETHLAGVSRYEGADRVLRSRSIAIPFGSAADAENVDSVCSLGNRKDGVYRRLIESEGVQVIEGTLDLVRHLLERRVPVGLASSSENCARVLELAGLSELFPTVVDGRVLAALGLLGKPAPDLFLKCSQLLGVAPAASAVVEDAASGVAAARAGGFGLVVGLGPQASVELLTEAGADLVLPTLAGVSVDHLESWLQGSSRKYMGAGRHTFDGR